MVSSRYIVLVLIIATLIGCASHSESKTTTSQSTQASASCPVYESRNWHAWIDQSNESSDSALLNIRGEIDLPSPGHLINIVAGPLDRRQPPSLKVLVDVLPPREPAIQVITAKNIEYSMETSILHYRSIVILCDERQLAALVNVSAN